MYRTLLGILAVFAGVLVIVGFTFSKATEGPAELTFTNETEPKSLDPGTMTGEPEGRLAWELYEGLTRYDAKSMLPVPGVAESWELSPDGKTYTFHLRENARWTDGRPVTAHDFVWSWKRLLDPVTASEYAYMAFPIRLAEEFSTYAALAKSLDGEVLPEFERLARTHPGGLPASDWQKFLSDHHAHDPLRGSVPPEIEAFFSRRQGSLSADDLTMLRAAFQSALAELGRGAAEAKRHLGVDAGFFAKGDRTLVVELRSPIPYFLELTTFYSLMPVPRWVVEKHPNDWFFPETFVGNGPFRLARWVVNDHVRLVKSETYWGKDEVRLSSVDALAVETEMPALNLYLTGKTQWFPKYLPRDLARALTKRKDFRTTTANTVYFYRLNTTRKPLDDKRVRKALNLAIDRKLITDNVTGFGEVPAYTLVPPVLPDYQSPPSAIRYDVAEARELLREAGYPGGKGFPKLGILYNTLESHKKIADVIADQLRRNLGIEVGAYNQEWQSYLATVRNLDYDIARGGWGGDYSDPNTFVDLWVTNGGNNDTGFGNALYDDLVRYAGNVELFLGAAERLLPKLHEPNAIRVLLEPARSAPTPEARLEVRAKLRMQLLREAEAIILQDEFPIIPIYFYVNPNLVRPSVHGFYTTLELPDGRKGVNLRDIHPLRAVWMDHAGEGGP